MQASKSDHFFVKCAHKDCAKTSPLTRGMCSEHYALTAERERASGSYAPLDRPHRDWLPYQRTKPYASTGTAFGRRAPVGAPEAFIREHVAHKGGDCVIWPYARAWNGYPEMRFEGRPARAHRVMCKLAHGEPPLPDFEASHTCENGHLGCVNPQHLIWESHYDNHQRKRGHLEAAERRKGTKLVRKQRHPDLILE